MMKKVLLQASAALFSLSILMGTSISTASAQEATGKIEIGKNFKKEIIVSIPNPKIQPRDLAPNISSERVVFIESSNTQAQKGEIIAPGQYTTKYDEGGELMEVTVEEIGYGSNYPQMTMAGQPLAHSAIEQRVPFCVENGQVTTSCPAGTTAVGYLYVINLSGYQSGKFTFSNRSQNQPSVTASTYLNIL